MSTTRWWSTARSATSKFGGDYDSWNLLVDLMNHATAAQTVYVQVTYSTRPSSEPVQSVKPVWLDIDQCGDSEYWIPAGFSDTHWDWNVNVPGKIIGMIGHLHGHGVTGFAARRPRDRSTLSASRRASCGARNSGPAGPGFGNSSLTGQIGFHPSWSPCILTLWASLEDDAIRVARAAAASRGALEGFNAELERDFASTFRCAQPCTETWSSWTP